MSLIFTLKATGERPRKRRKTRDADWGNDGMQFIHADAMSDLLVNVGMDMDMDGGGEFV